MLEDRLLLWKLRRGDTGALRQVYEQHKHDMLGLAISLTGDRASGEDIVHDVFIALVRISPKLRLRTNLRSYLLTSVANRVRSLSRVRMRPVRPIDQIEAGAADADRSDRAAIQAEQATIIDRALAQLPCEQREALVLHLQAGMKFREIASSQNVSINTVQSHYRYGLQKLRSLLDGKVTP
jgi:RNA polymerase sigma-70 factor (ECF subfamily)